MLADGATATEAEIIAHCRTRIAGYKAPKRVEFRDAIPRTATGKIQKFKLREAFWAGAAPPSRTIARVEEELGWEFNQIYGLTETAPLLTINRPRAEFDDLDPEERAKKLSRAGVPAVGIRLKTASSTSIDDTFSPPVMITSFLRSEIVR